MHLYEMQNSFLSAEVWRGLQIIAQVRSIVSTGPLGVEEVRGVLRRRRPS